MTEKLRAHKKTLLICLLLFAVAFVVYYFTGEGHPTYYNYYVRLADAFLHGRLYLLDNPSWLNELVPNPFGPGYYVVYPPLPAVLMTPLVAIWGLNLNQTLVSVFFGSLTVVVAYFVAKDVTREAGAEKPKSQSVYVWFTVLFGFGTIFWWLSSNGSVWLIAQVISAFFLLLAIHEAFNKGRPLVMGLLVGASFWCRLPTILGILFFAGLIISRQQSLNWSGKIRSSIKPMLLLAVGAGVFVALDVAYNYVRFKAFFDVAYWMIPGVLNEPWYSHGLFSLLYIPVNLVPFLTGLPMFNLTAPFMHAPIQGIAIWFTTPAFIFALRSKLKDAVTISAWVAIFATAGVIFTKGLSGWGFGYRYAVDFYPFLFILTIRGMGTNLRWYHKILIILGVIVNLWGTIAFNRFPN
jgi:multisubunit Na+/H+ antiporter MnhG subunit